MKQRTNGFTVIELIVTIFVLIVIGILFWTQKHNLEVANRDDTRRTAINAMYYDLEDVYYAQHSSYPKTLSTQNMTAMDSKLLTDPNGKKIGDKDSDYRYIPTNCTDDQCKSYTLRASMEAEADFVKTSRHH